MFTLIKIEVNMMQEKENPKKIINAKNAANHLSLGQTKTVRHGAQGKLHISVKTKTMVLRYVLIALKQNKRMI